MIGINNSNKYRLNNNNKQLHLEIIHHNHVELHKKYTFIVKKKDEIFFVLKK